MPRASSNGRRTSIEQLEEAAGELYKLNSEVLGLPDLPIRAIKVEQHFRVTDLLEKLILKMDGYTLTTEKSRTSRKKLIMEAQVLTEKADAMVYSAKDKPVRKPQKPATVVADTDGAPLKKKYIGTLKKESNKIDFTGMDPLKMSAEEYQKYIKHERMKKKKHEEKRKAQEMKRIRYEYGLGIRDGPPPPVNADDVEKARKAQMARWNARVNEKLAKAFAVLEDSEAAERAERGKEEEETRAKEEAIEAANQAETKRVEKEAREKRQPPMGVDDLEKLKKAKRAAANASLNERLFKAEQAGEDFYKPTPPAPKPTPPTPKPTPSAPKATPAAPRPTPAASASKAASSTPKRVPKPKPRKPSADQLDEGAGKVYAFSLNVKRLPDLPIQAFRMEEHARIMEELEKLIIKMESYELTTTESLQQRKRMILEAHALMGEADELVYKGQKKPEKIVPVEKELPAVDLGGRKPHELSAEEYQKYAKVLKAQKDREAKLKKEQDWARISYQYGFGDAAAAKARYLGNAPPPRSEAAPKPPSVAQGNRGHDASSRIGWSRETTKPSSNFAKGPAKSSAPNAESKGDSAEEKRERMLRQAAEACGITYNASPPAKGPSSNDSKRSFANYQKPSVEDADQATVAGDKKVEDWRNMPSFPVPSGNEAPKSDKSESEKSKSGSGSGTNKPEPPQKKNWLDEPGALELNKPPAWFAKAQGSEAPKSVAPTPKKKGRARIPPPGMPAEDYEKWKADPDSYVVPKQPTPPPPSPPKPKSLPKKQVDAGGAGGAGGKPPNLPGPQPAARPPSPTPPKRQPKPTTPPKMQAGADAGGAGGKPRRPPGPPRAARPPPQDDSDDEPPRPPHLTISEADEQTRQWLESTPNVPPPPPEKRQKGDRGGDGTHYHRDREDTMDPDDSLSVRHAYQLPGAERRKAAKALEPGAVWTARDEAIFQSYRGNYYPPQTDAQRREAWLNREPGVVWTAKDEASFQEMINHQPPATDAQRREAWLARDADVMWTAKDEARWQSRMRKKQPHRTDAQRRASWIAREPDLVWTKEDEFRFQEEKKNHPITEAKRRWKMAVRDHDAKVAEVCQQWGPEEFEDKVRQVMDMIEAGAYERWKYRL